jgi:CHAD domain-containing protein
MAGGEDMSYCLESAETLSAGIVRIAREQVDAALEQLEERPDGLDEAIHDARKRFKKIRAVLRLVRYEVGEEFYKQENRRYRNAGRLLSDLRDSAVKVETLRSLRAHFGDLLMEDAFNTIHERLRKDAEEIRSQFVGESDAIDEVRKMILGGRELIETWPVEGDGFSMVDRGLRRVYKRGLRRMEGSREDLTDENLHDWRKRVKYLWYHVRILNPIWPELMDELASAIHHLSDLLGDDHDLAVLRQTILSNPEISSTPEKFQDLIGLIDRRRRQYQSEAWPLGGRIYSERPAAFLDRMAAYWDVMREGN